MKFIVFGPTFDATDRLFNDIKNREDIIYIHNPVRNESKLIERIITAHINRFSKVPLKKIWCHFIKRFIYSRDEQICFLYCEFKWIKILEEIHFVEKMKIRYKKSKHIVYLTDVNKAKRLSYDKSKNIFDDFYVFDKRIAAELGIKYYPLFYSKFKDKPADEKYKSQVSFVGQVKDRFEDIISVYETLSKQNIKCNFYLIGVEPDKQKYKPYIKYGSFISAYEAYKYTYNSDCLLEIQSKTNNSISIRVMEAIVDNKKILTNNEEIQNLYYYDSKYMQIYSSVNDINLDFFLNRVKPNYQYNNEFSPIYFLKYIEKNYFETEI